MTSQTVVLHIPHPAQQQSTCARGGAELQKDQGHSHLKGNRGVRGSGRHQRGQCMIHAILAVRF